jgi:hypothetical protein
MKRKIKRKRKDAGYFEETWVPIPDQYTLTHNEDEGGVADVTNMRANAPRGDRFAAGHEIGHLFLEQLTTPEEKARIQRILKINGAWDQGTGLEGGYSSPSEHAADYYAAAATGFDPARYGLGGYTQIGARKLKRFKIYLDKIGRERGLRQYGSDGLTDYGIFE